MLFVSTCRRNDAETGKRLVDSIPLERAHVCMYERGYFPRVKNAYGPTCLPNIVA